nr:translation initiation factor IF-2-like [Aegilops tauschii subsp. strangulata]
MPSRRPRPRLPPRAPATRQQLPSALGPRARGADPPRSATRRPAMPCSRLAPARSRPPRPAPPRPRLAPPRLRLAAGRASPCPAPLPPAAARAHHTRSQPSARPASTSTTHQRPRAGRVRPATAAPALPELVVEASGSMKQASMAVEKEKKEERGNGWADGPFLFV